MWAMLARGKAGRPPDGDRAAIGSKTLSPGLAHVERVAHSCHEVWTTVIPLSVGTNIRGP
jgi:hypothetical protein